MTCNLILKGTKPSPNTPLENLSSFDSYIWEKKGKKRGGGGGGVAVVFRWIIDINRILCFMFMGPIVT